MAADKVHHVGSMAELQKLFDSTTYVLIDFSADWCGPCRIIAPIYENLATQHSADGVLAFAKVDVDRAQDVAKAYSITAMPTFMFFKEGKQVAVNGQDMLRGADRSALTAAAEKLGSLAQNKIAGGATN